jgi:PAS domain-containing protein
MKFKIMNRQLLSAAIIIFYLIPLLFFSAYSITLMSHHKSWTLLSLGLLLTVFGTLALMLLLFYWEQSMRDKKQGSFLFSAQKNSSSPTEKETKVTSLDPSLIFSPSSHHEPDYAGTKENSKELNLLQAALKASQEQQEQLAKTLEIKTQELQKQEEENKQLQLKVQQVAQDFADYKLFSEEQLKQKQLQLTSLQQIIEDQRAEMEKRQEQIYQLDTKVHDLSYEIKTLLYLHEEETAPQKASTTIKEDASRAFLHGALQESQETASVAILAPPVSSDTHVLENPVRTATEAASLLKKCITIAQKLTGSNYYSNESSRYREFSSSYFAIDQRRLFDNLRSETGALIIVYSQKEHKLLFANNESKTMLGWSPEKLLADFSSIMQEGIYDWKKAVTLLATSSEAHARLLAKTKNGQEVLLNCHLGVVPTGLFRNYVIGVLYPA